MLKQDQHNENKVSTNNLLDKLDFIKKFISRNHTKKTSLNYNEEINRFRSKIKKK